MRLDAQQADALEQAKLYARRLKSSGKTYKEVAEIMRAEGWTNPRTNRPFSVSTLSEISRGLGDQRGQRQAKHGDTLEERAAYWREYHRVYYAKYRAENSELMKQKIAEYRAAETEAFREARLAYQRERRKRRLANETAEEREQRRAKEREYRKRKRANETVEEREQRRAYHREWHRRRRALRNDK
jgi:hypothetical protein